MVDHLASTLLRRQLTVAVAEASTGGAIADRLTDLPGASAYFLGGVVAYANQQKERLLGVPAQLLLAHVAVSAEVAAAMAGNVRKSFGSDLGLAATGILGPGGATPQKPVGLSFVAVADASTERVERHLFRGSRTQNKRATVDAALELCCSFLGNPGR